MNYWIFQGNPQRFTADKEKYPHLHDINSYVKEEQTIDWSIRQKHHLNDLKIGDQVFIWRSDGAEKNSGGIIAKTEIVSEPYVKEDGISAVDLAVIDARTTEEEGMLHRYKLKELPETKDLLIIRAPQMTNYKLTEEHFNYLNYYWDNPTKLSNKMTMPLIDRYLYYYKNEVKTPLHELDYITKSYEYFQQFRNPEFIKNIEWDELQKIGTHVNAYRMAIARSRAFGKMNAPIEKYRESFTYLVHGKDPIEVRMDRFLNDPDVKLFGIGENALSEMIGNIFPEKYCFYNQRDRVAVENVLEIDPKYRRGGNFAEKFLKFQQALIDHKIVERYKKIVGRLSDLPILYEVDQFFSFIFEKNKPSVENEVDDEDIVYDVEINEIDEPYVAESSNSSIYTISDITKDLFMDLEKIEDAIESLQYKKNIILQGPPGVGKTFVAKRLAYLHMGKKQPENIEMVQFHQSYSYEEFIRGFKPTEEGHFELQDGLFYSFCKKAKTNPTENYYFIIDEINRGNLSKIFGEVMMLIEADKRGPEYAIKLTYSKADETFYIPENVYVIAMMNTADRSLAMVDYALRRRFAFIDLIPGFHTEAFEEHLKAKGVSQGFIDRIRIFMDEVNAEISRDNVNLGKGFEIGHSYFSPSKKIEDEQSWYERIIRLEIKPLLAEYWFDQEDKVDDLISKC